LPRFEKRAGKLLENNGEEVLTRIKKTEDKKKLLAFYSGQVYN